MSFAKLPNCLLCLHDFEASDILFEQRLIGDIEFCARCFGEILSDRTDEDLTYDLSTIQIH
jgi:hypothetical protein